MAIGIERIQRLSPQDSFACVSTSVAIKSTRSMTVIIRSFANQIAVPLRSDPFRNLLDRECVIEVPPGLINIPKIHHTALSLL